MKKFFFEKNFENTIFKATGINLKRANNNPIFGLDKFFDDLYKEFESEKIKINEMNEEDYIEIVKRSYFFKNIKDLNDILKRNEKIAMRIIYSTTAVAALIGMNPIPMTDALILIPVQGAMVISIAGVYGRYKTAKDLGLVTASGASSLFWNIFGKAAGLFGGFLKVIPGIGTIIGGFICSSVAGTTTYVMGKSALEILDKDVKKCGGFELFKDYAKSYNRAVDSLLELKKKFARGEITNRSCE